MLFFTSCKCAIIVTSATVGERLDKNESGRLYDSNVTKSKRENICALPDLLDICAKKQFSKKF